MVMTLPEVGSLRVNANYPPDCDWCAETQNVYWIPQANNYLCDECYHEWRRETTEPET
jgi:hypothetical protein